jgi:hypothetical protein
LITPYIIVESNPIIEKIVFEESVIANSSSFQC